MNDLLKKWRSRINYKRWGQNYEICINSLQTIYTLIKQYKKDVNKIELSKYEVVEELMNFISHGVGALSYIAVLILCIIKVKSPLALYARLFSSISSTILYL